MASYDALSLYATRLYRRFNPTALLPYNRSDAEDERIRDVITGWPLPVLVSTHRSGSEFVNFSVKLEKHKVNLPRCNRRKVIKLQILLKLFKKKSLPSV